VGADEAVLDGAELLKVALRLVAHAPAPRAAVARDNPVAVVREVTHRAVCHVRHHRSAREREQAAEDLFVDESAAGRVVVDQHQIGPQQAARTQPAVVQVVGLEAACDVRVLDGDLGGREAAPQLVHESARDAKVVEARDRVAHHRDVQRRLRLRQPSAQSGHAAARVRGLLQAARSAPLAQLVTRRGALCHVDPP
jgi:hypothetical protein